MIAQVRPTDLAAWFSTVKEHGAPVVLDVREPAELRTASVKPDGFELVTIPMGTIPVRLSELDPGQPVYLRLYELSLFCIYQPIP